MGLEVNSLVDERRDPIKSSAMAARYLKDLYSIYHDWALAIASYNCGPGNVSKAIRRSGGKTDYWEIYDTSSPFAADIRCITDSDRGDSKFESSISSRHYTG